MECLKFYFNKDGAIDQVFLENWLSKNQPLDRWFFVHLIEVAGQRFLDQSFSAHKSEIARSMIPLYPVPLFWMNGLNGVMKVRAKPHLLDNLRHWEKAI